MNQEKALDLIIHKIKKDYAEDVAFLAIMGSYARGTHHEHSDLDLFFLPSTPRGESLGFTFILDGIGYDLWPISLSRLQNIASQKEPLASILAEAKIKYWHTEEDLERFLALKEKAKTSASKEVLLEKLPLLKSKLQESAFSLLLMKDLAEFRKIAMKQVKTIFYVLSLLHGTAPSGNYLKNKENLITMTGVPKDFYAHLDGLFEEDTLEELKTHVIDVTETAVHLIEDFLGSAEARRSPAKEVFNGFYEELVNHYHKIRHAAERNDPKECLLAAASLENEISETLAHVSGNLPVLPPLVGAFHPNDLRSMVDAAKIHEDAFLLYLKNEEVPLRVFETIEEFSAYLDNLS
ncbi:nucleotidyltransferase domain-containing protein [Proteiniclasticum ruminis]|uniref:Nucleotidyltransferase domain-containing protein n=1 Tax=Proteiniclasticum ruminis TaxID=398199 RepID=A0A1I4Z2J1_9CLOT|nr:nucleotidyltransferase domain-containing protein [Proteiniclasticum ruminis]SFN44494.1 Nucleotidyltransferase domain-containing protein [Proteiniclasticum ruminis]